MADSSISFAQLTTAATEIRRFRAGQAIFEKGEALFRQGDVLVQEIFAKSFASLSEPERDALAALLTKLLG